MKAVRLATFFIIILVSFGVYYNAFFCDFVYDDMAQVLENPWIREIRSIPDIFVNSVSGFVTGSSPVNYYRPFMHLIYLINYHLFGLTPWGFHLVNVLFHAGNSVLVFLITAKLLSQSAAMPAVESPSRNSSGFILHNFFPPAFIAALLFAVHPIHSEAVTWVAGLPDVSCAFFFLLSLYFYILSANATKKPIARSDTSAYSIQEQALGITNKGNLLYICSVVFFFFASLSKEPALTLPVILVLYDYVFRKEQSGIRSAVKRYVPYVLVSVCYIGLRMHALGNLSPVKAYPELSAYDFVINVFPLFAQYIEKLFLPVDLNVWHTFYPLTSLLTPKAIVSFIGTATFLCLFLLAFRKNAPAFIGLALFLVPLLPAFYIPGIVGKPFAERYLYLPSFGFVFLCAVLQDRVIHNPKRAVLVTIFLAVAVLLSVATINRNAVWKDNLTLFMDSTQKSPDAFMPRSGLANALFEKGKIDEAIEQYRTALSLLALMPADPAVLSATLRNLGTCFFYKNLIDQAIEQYRLAVMAKPDYAEAHADLAFAYAEKGWLEWAIAEYRTALQLQPRSARRTADIHNNLGVAFLKTGLVDQAREQFEEALKLNPENPAFAGNLRETYNPARDSKREHLPD
jgi:tetratricopeptide (TPR) repeat protein